MLIVNVAVTTMQYAVSTSGFLDDVMFSRDRPLWYESGGRIT